ncbi:MAG: hypothetical protein J6V84_01425 [Clostridia bacterium]|nr:hypothetical protein [Clostridia bacterium]
MKNRVAALLLIVLMLLPVLASCSKEVPPTETEVTVYTLHMIKGDTTTEEAIKKVELALNRILFYRLGSCVEIHAYTEDEYYDVIEAKYAEMEEYKLKKEEEKKNNKDKDKNKDKNESSEEVSVDVFTGDDYLDLLMDGGEYVREEPRFDIFLINDYDKYYELATDGKLSAINEILNSECKILKDYIHPTILSAAVIDKKTYGIPLNTIIGEYSYMVFDKELLDQHGVDYQTMKSLDDLQDYLSVIAEQNPDVVPLSNTADPTSVDYIFSSLSPAYVKDKYVHSSFESSELASYYSVIQMFNSMGYLREADEDDRIAVQFISGNEETIAKLEAETGREYEYTVYSNPVATNDNCINGIFAFSSFCTANELKAAMELVAAIYTNPELANIFAYGVEGEHYLLNDDGQVERRNEDYIIDPEYSGNRFLTYTLAGDDADKWEKAKLQNLNAEIAVDIGFTLQPNEFTWEIEVEDENGEKTKEEIIVASPNYIDIINKISSKYYYDIVNGKALELDLEALYAEAEAGIEDTLRANLQNTYASRIQNNYSNTVSARYSLDSAEGKKIYADAEKEINDSLFTQVKNELIVKYERELIEELTSMYDDEEKLKAAVQERLDKLLTEDFINQAIQNEYADKIDEYIMAKYNQTVQSKVDAAVKAYLQTELYLTEYEAAIASAEFEAELEEALNSDLSATISTSVNTLITTMMTDYFAVIIAECNEELEIALEDFIAEVVAASEKYDGEEAMTEDEVRFELGLMTKETESDEEGNVTSETYIPVDITAYEYVIKEITNQYYNMFGDPTKPAA